MDEQPIFGVRESAALAADPSFPNLETRELLRSICETINDQADSRALSYMRKRLVIIKDDPDPATRGWARELLMRIDAFGTEYVRKLVRAVNGE